MNPTDADIVDPGFEPPAEDDAAAEGKSTADSVAQPSQISGQEAANDETRASEEESQSQIPGDPRPVNEEQPPTKEQY